MSDKPTGISADDFLPNQFGKMSVSNSSPFGWPQTELSESEVTSSILKGHPNMMAVLTARSRNINIIRQMWTNKDAKTAAEHAYQIGSPRSGDSEMFSTFSADAKYMENKFGGLRSKGWSGDASSDSLSGFFFFGLVCIALAFASV